jgi:beta-lactamase superfamily II metal-dependent hydrolase
MMPWTDRFALTFALAFALSNAKITVPSSNSTVTVKAFNSISPKNNIWPAVHYVFPILPGTENMDGDLLAFLVENPSTHSRVMFDIGMRKDVQNFAPSVVKLLKGFKLEVEDDIPTQLKNGNVTLESIDAVIWSHKHFDHIGWLQSFSFSCSYLTTS